MAVTAVCAITAADLTDNRLHFWLLGQGVRVARDQALGASPNVGLSSGGGGTLLAALLLGAATVAIVRYRRAD